MSKLIKKRLSKTRLVSRILIRLPFVRCVILNGSLASGGHKKLSDIDILIIAKNGRIFTARFFVNLLASIFHIKRSKNDEEGHSGKFCFNYFLAEDYLKIPTGRGEKMDRYCAQNYSKSQFIAGDVNLFKKYMEANKGLFNKYGFRIQISKFKSQNDNSKFKINLLQALLEHSLQDSFEKIVKKYQIKRIKSDPRTKKYPKLIVYNDRELRFHPPK